MNMSKKYNFVYVTTNLINQKQYVGSHCTDNINDNYLGSGRLFLKALNKYKKENFVREILEQYDIDLDARKKEEFYINKYNTLSPNGYNLSPKGGIGFKGATQSEETKRKQSIWQKGKTIEELYGLEKANEIKRKQSEKKKNKSTSRKGKGHKQQLIERYGEIDGLIRYDKFIEKQRQSHLNKKQSQETIQKRLKSTGDPWNKGIKYKLGAYSKDRIEKTKIGQLKVFYKKLDLNKVKFIKENYQTNSLLFLIKNTNYKFYKIKRIIELIQTNKL